MNTTQKLTKKQKKGLAFRERKSGKRHEQDELEMEANAIPAMENEDITGDVGHTAKNSGNNDKEKGKTVDDTGRGEGERQESKVGGKGKGKGKGENVLDAVEVARQVTRKRKREEDGEGTVGGKESTETTALTKAAKRMKTGEERTGEESKEKQLKQRFILFLGNLKYTTPLSAIQTHFAKCDPPPTVRLLTPKSVGSGPTQKLKSKGCAFLEFTHRNALQQGLKLHQTTLDGRMINVELTAGGGGRSESRLTRVRERNKALLGQREERIEKEATNDNSFQNLPSRPQRFSATSGLEHAPSKNKTWTVGDVDDGTTHRGGRRRAKKSKGSSKTWGTGVNAIPVG